MDGLLSLSAYTAARPPTVILSEILHPPGVHMRACAGKLTRGSTSKQRHPEGKRDIEPAPSAMHAGRGEESGGEICMPLCSWHLVGTSLATRALGAYTVVA